jgi:hypothetical protein
MKLLFVLIISFFTFNLSAQPIKLKKKWQKFYVGKIPAYEVSLNNQAVQIDAVQIKVQLTKDSIYIQVGSAKWAGIYSASKLEKKKVEITGRMIGTGIPEILKLDMREKKIIRKGLFPQPDAVLNRIKSYSNF